jgi:hypothetical protein
MPSQFKMEKLTSLFTASEEEGEKTLRRSEDTDTI